MSDTPPLMVSGTLVRSYVKTLKQIGRFDSVRARVGPAAVDYLDSPPMVWSWVDAVPVMELFDAVEEDAGEEVLRVSGLQVCQESLGNVALPIFRTLLNIWGTTPITLYKNMQTLSAPFCRGHVFTYRETGGTSAELKLTYPLPHAQTSFRFWAGCLAFPLEFTKRVGTVSPALPLGEREALYTVSWKD